MKTINDIAIMLEAFGPRIKNVPNTELDVVNAAFKKLGLRKISSLDSTGDSGYNSKVAASVYPSIRKAVAERLGINPNNDQLSTWSTNNGLTNEIYTIFYSNNKETKKRVKEMIKKIQSDEGHYEAIRMLIDSLVARLQYMIGR